MRSKWLRIYRAGQRSLASAALRALADVRDKRWRAAAAVVLAAGAYWLWGLSPAMLWLLFLLFLVYEWENRIIGVLALLALAACPALLSLGQNARAETMAVYAYYFLVMTVALQIAEYKRHPSDYAED